MKRFHQVLLIATFLPLCWLAMMAVHELGHVVAALATGGKVSHVVLHPLTISRTELTGNPCPTLVVWAGPIVGVLFPLGLYAIFRIAQFPRKYLIQFFAGFCLIANGSYIGFGSFNAIGDAGEMLSHNSPICCLWLFGLVASAFGLSLWHGLGPSFGLGKSAGEVDRDAAYVSCGLLLLTLLLEFMLSPR